MQRQRPVTIVALKMDSQHPDFQDYNAAPAKDKIDKIVLRIEELCEQLQEKEPDATWIITWREYGITEANSKFISPEIKKYLKEKMEALTKKYPQLTIIAGTVATKEVIPFDVIELRRLENYFKQNHWIMKEEGGYGISEQHMLNHLKALLNRQITMSTDPLTIIRNTALIFRKGECYRERDKKSPFDETNNSDLSGISEGLNYAYLYQLGNQKNNNCHILIKDKSDKPIDLALEICREHMYRVFVTEDQQKKIRPDIHLVLGFGAYPVPNNMKGNVFILVEDNYQSQLFIDYDIKFDELKKFSYRLYDNNLFGNKNLEGPFVPLYIEERNIANIFNEIENLFANQARPKKIVQKLREAFDYRIPIRKGDHNYDVKNLQQEFTNHHSYRVLQEFIKQDPDANKRIAFYTLLKKLKEAIGSLTLTYLYEKIPLTYPDEYLPKPKTQMKLFDSTKTPETPKEEMLNESKKQCT